MTDEQSPASRILIVDDDEALLRLHVRALSGAGFEVTAAADGAQAVKAIEQSAFEVILSDIDMRGLDGLKLLAHVRTHDLDVPVVLITGSPSVETAARAMELGALRYLVKPVQLKEIISVTRDAIYFHRIAKAKRKALDIAGGIDRFLGDEAGLTASFDRALSTLYVVYQPIVRWSTHSIYAYEALLRSREPSLPHPGAMLDAAERLGRIHELGRKIRDRAIEPLDALPRDVSLFINLHPRDLVDDGLSELGDEAGSVARRVVFEVTERASLAGMHDVRERVALLRHKGFRIAVDDLGAGYAGLTSFALLEPDVVKLDMALIRNIHVEPTKQTVVRTLIAMCKELRITVTAEGIETTAERDEVISAGCDLLQGYLFAKPGEGFPAPSF
jgi:EAL domain-containing protein (putative c-di-GMP-specific phosphodiesterase class I)